MSQPVHPDKASSYRIAIAKGQHLLNMTLASDSKAGAMLNPPQPSASSAFLSQSCREDWGYVRALHPYDASETANLDTLTSMVLPRSRSEHTNTRVRIRDLHNESVSHDGIVFPSTSATFRSLVDRANGVLVAQHNYGPAHIVAESEMIIPVPKLEHYSDIAYLQWSDPRLRHLPNDLQHVIRMRIENDETLAVIERVLAVDYRKEHRTPEYWVSDVEGLTWDIETEAAKALLGTPNGSGVAWLLVQHKTQLGWKVVESVTLFWEQVDRTNMLEHPSLLFRFEDVID
jgi:hypothetical protein